MKNMREFSTSISKRVRVHRWLPIHAKLSNLLLTFLWRIVLRMDHVQNLIEVGANRGNISKSFCRSNVSRKAWAFEANRDIFRDFTSRNIPNNMQAINLGIGSSDKNSVPLKIPLQKRSKFSGNGSFLTRLESDEYETLDVEMVSLDNYFQQNFQYEPAAIWIDVEGYSLQVLKGATQLLNSNRISHIFIELESWNFWTAGANANEIHDLLRGYGFHIVARDFEHPGQYNCIYRRIELSNSIKFVKSIYTLLENSIWVISIVGLPIEFLILFAKKMNSKLINFS